MFCMKCGKELPDDAVFCVKCGYQVGAEGTEEAEPAKVIPEVVDEKPVEPTPPPVVEEKKPKKKKGGKIFLLILLVAALVLGRQYILPYINMMTGGKVGGATEYYTVNDVIDNEDFTLQITDARFVESADFSTFEGNETATAPNAQGETTLFLKFSVTNKGNKEISLFTDPITVLVGDIVYDDTNAVIKYYCIEKDDVDGDIAPLATKTYNYCVFNLPGGVLESTDTSVKVSFYGNNYIISLSE